MFDLRFVHGISGYMTETEISSHKMSATSQSVVTILHPRARSHHDETILSTGGVKSLETFNHKLEMTAAGCCHPGSDVG